MDSVRRYGFQRGLGVPVPVFVLALALGAWSACGAPTAYRPDTGLVARLGRDEVVARLRTVLDRAQAPTVIDVRVTNEHIDLVWLDTREVSRWRFRAIESIDIRSSDHVVKLRLENKRYVYGLDFTNDADATALVDLIMSLYQAGSSAEVELPPITRDQERP